MIGIFGANAGAAGGLVTFVIPLLFIVGMFWFMSRGQKKQQKQRQEMLDNVSIGSHVVTIGGLHGVISEVNTADKTVVIDCEGIYLEFDRSAIRTVTPGTTYNTSSAETTEVEEVEVVENNSTEDSESQE